MDIEAMAVNAFSLPLSEFPMRGGSMSMSQGLSPAASPYGMTGPTMQSNVNFSTIDSPRHAMSPLSFNVTDNDCIVKATTVTAGVSNLSLGFT